MLSLLENILPLYETWDVPAVFVSTHLKAFPHCMMIAVPIIINNAHTDYNSSINEDNIPQVRQEVL
jgi:hypothetical protein